MISNEEYAPNCWVLGDPAYIRNGEEWVFFDREPTHLMEYLHYRDQIMYDEEYSGYSLMVLDMMIDTIVFVDDALMNMMNPYN